MPGITFAPGEQKIRPGVYVRVSNAGAPQTQTVPQGIVAVLFRSSWGPLGQVVDITDEASVYATFGSGGTTDAIIQALRGGCARVKALRLGSGGQAASLTLTDTATTPAQCVKLNAKYPGTRNLKATLRDSLSNSSQRELLIYDGTTLLQRITYPKGTGEPQTLTNAVNSANSPYISATKLSDGNGTLKSVTQQAFTGGTDPTVATTDYSNAMNTLAAYDWNVLAVDSEDPSVHAMVQTFVDGQRENGKHVLAVVGESTRVALATRQSDAQAFNDYAMHYVLNGFQQSDGTNIEGYLAAARVAGMIASADITESLTHAIVRGAVDIVGPLANPDIEASIQSGAIVFTKNAQGQVQIEYGINTYINPDEDHDAGWMKIRRVRTRDYLIDTIAATWDPLIGKVNNDPEGRATLIAAAQSVIYRMIAMGALLDGSIAEDTSNLPSGDSAWFVITADDVDSAEKLYINFAFEFAPPAPTATAS